MSLTDALFFTERLIAIAVALQTLELLLLSRVYSEAGVWRLSILEKEFDLFPKPITHALRFCLHETSFRWILVARLVASLLGTFSSHPGYWAIMLFSTLLICIRWRGTFNGGSDYMTVVVLLSVTVANIFPHELVLLGALWYIALQVTLSYFVAGAVKLLRPNWRRGIALSTFLSASPYPLPSALRSLISKPGLVFIASCGIILFECSAPLVFFLSGYTLPFITAAFCFHLSTVYAFGLNRFLFAWAAAYPALYYCSTLVTAAV